MLFNTYEIEEKGLLFYISVLVHLAQRRLEKGYYCADTCLFILIQKRLSKGYKGYYRAKEITFRQAKACKVTIVKS